MKTLWFKQEFVAPILAGMKRDTIRFQSSRLPSIGDVVAFSVGPRPAFARATISHIEDVLPQALTQERAQQLARCAIDETKPLVRLTFCVQHTATALPHQSP